MMNIRRLGAVDIGSNSVKLLICDIINHETRIVNKKFIHMRMPLQLGNDTFLSGYISDDKKEKLARLIQTYKSFLEISETEKYRVCATSALREAENKEEIIDYIYTTVGVEIEIISSKDEANFIFLNITEKGCKPKTSYVIVDVGGGSTEIILSQDQLLLETESFRLGTIRSLSREQEVEEWNRLKRWLEDRRNNLYNISLVGSGGNINKINSLFNRRGKIRKIDLKDFYKTLKNMDYEERVIKSNFGLNRIEVILPAVNIFLNIMKILKAGSIQIPVIGIADGIIKDLYLKEYDFDDSSAIISEP